MLMIISRIPRAIGKDGLSLVRALIFIAFWLAAAGCEGKSTQIAAKAAAPAKNQAREVNVYTGRHYDSDIAIFDAFTKKTGIRVNYIEGGADALIERLAREAEASPADVFIAADAGMLWRAKERELLRPFADPKTYERAPARFRDPEGEWVGLSKRVRVIIYNKEQGPPVGVSAYRDLASENLRGKICMRSSTNIYNQSLLASLIAHDGADAARAFAAGVVANFARPPEGNDTTQIEAVAAGLCGVSLVNSYYLARYVGSTDVKMRAIGEKVGVIFPDQNSNGAHVNISGAGIVRHAPNAKNAEALIAYLLTDEAQAAFSRGNNEYPVVETVAASGPIAAFGEFREDTLAMGALGEHQAAAVRIFDEAGWR